MKTNNIVYWVSTITVVSAMIFSSYADLLSPQVRTAFVHLGFPGYFRIELGIFKIVGIALLLAPLPPRSKEWPYVGFAITFISAFIAHTASGDPIGNRAAPLIILLFLMISYFTYHKKTASV